MSMFELPPPEFSADDARDTADQVLSGRAYLEAARPPSLRERILEWIGDFVADVLDALSSSGGRGVFAWVIVGLFAAVIVFLLSRLMRNLGPLPTTVVDDGPMIDISGGLSPNEWLERAELAEATGDWRDGIRSRHRALVTDLANREIVSTRPGQTAGELAAAVSASVPHAADAMDEATWLFKDTWYGWVSADVASRDTFVRLSAQILDATVDYRPPEPLLVGTAQR